MKISKVLLLASAFLLVACNSNPITSSNTSASTVVDSSEESTSSSGVSTSEITSSSSSSSISSSETPVADKTLTINLFNPSCGSVSTEALDAKLLEYINQEAGTTFVREVKNSKCQISNDIPNKGEKVLIIGSASAQGSLEFTFAEAIKSVTITAQTYHKPYKDYATGNTIANVDTDSVLYVNETNSVDLKPVNDEPVEKEYTTDLNAKTLKLNNSSEEKSRVFIKSLKFVY